MKLIYLMQALGTLMLMLCGGFMAFGMIFSEFQFIHDTSAMTFVIAGISKELITILCAVIFFGDEFGPINIAGLVIVIVGIIMFNIYKLYYLKKYAFYTDLFFFNRRARAGRSSIPRACARSTGRIARETRCPSRRASC